MNFEVSFRQCVHDVFGTFYPLDNIALSAFERVGNSADGGAKAIVSSFMKS